MALARIPVPPTLARGQHTDKSCFSKKTTGSLTVTLTRSSKVHGQIREFFFFLSFLLCTKQSLH